MPDEKGGSLWDTPLSLEQLIQNVNNIAQILSRLVTDLEGGGGLLFQPVNSLLTSLSALSATLTTNNLIMGSGLGTVAAKTLAQVITANIGNGTSGQFLETDGAGAFAWFSNTLKVALQPFTASGTYTPTTGILYTLLGTLGSGAGGGGTAQSTGEGSGGGGGAGSLSLALKTAAQVGASQTVTIGAAPNGGTAGNNAGTNGNDTSIGALCIGKGATGGGGAAANTSAISGAGGVAGTGDITGTGAPGGPGIAASIVTVTFQGAVGGSTILGGGGVGGSAAGGTGGNATNYGAGGGGGRSHNNSAAAAGGSGSQGIAFALDFCKV